MWRCVDPGLTDVSEERIASRRRHSSNLLLVLNQLPDWNRLNRAFKLVLKEFLCVHSFYILNDYFYLYMTRIMILFTCNDCMFSSIVMLYNLFPLMTVSTSSCIGSMERNKIELHCRMKTSSNSFHNWQRSQGIAKYHSIKKVMFILDKERVVRMDWFYDTAIDLLKLHSALQCRMVGW
jgi:hypothetical protein